MPTEEKTVLTRQHVYDLVWSKPLTHIAKEMRVSDVGFAKWCRDLDIPLPGVGYWQKIAWGKEVTKTPLPNPERTDELVLVRLERDEGLPDESPPKAPPEYVIFEQQPENRIVVDDELSKPHPYVSQAKKLLRNGEEDYQYHWLLPGARPCLDIRVGKDSLERALRIMDAILKALSKRKISLELTPKEQYSNMETAARIDGELVFFGIDAKLKMIERESNWSHNLEKCWIPTDILTLRIRAEYGNSYQQQWQDGRKTRVEDCLNDFVIALHEIVRKRKEWQLQALERERLAAERRKKNEEIRHLQDIELKKIQQLETRVTSWKKAQDIRSFVDAVVNAHSDIWKDNELGKYLVWALEQADRIDPLTESPPSVLDEKIESDW